MRSRSDCPPVVVVARRRRRCRRGSVLPGVCDEGVPDARPATALGDGALDLVGGGRDAPDEVGGKVEVGSRARCCFVAISSCHGPSSVLGEPRIGSGGHRRGVVVVSSAVDGGALLVDAAGVRSMRRTPAGRGRARARPGTAAGCTDAPGWAVTWSPSPRLDDLAVVHHGDAMAEVTHHGQVVRDEQVGDAGALLDLHEEVEHPRLGREVERRHGLVADDQLRVERERPGDGDALALPAARTRAAAGRPRSPAGARGRAGRRRAATRPRSRRRGAVSGSVRICSMVIDGLSEE